MFSAKWESGQFRNCPARSENSYFGGQSENSYFSWFNSGTGRAQSRNRDKLGIFIESPNNSKPLSCLLAFSSPNLD